MRVTALAGGVGGAKLVDGLAMILEAGALTTIVNTADDFEHLGLRICPDLDTVCYTLGGLANPLTGWGRVDETWNALEAIALLGGPSWFRIGDRDLATHLERTRRLAAGETLSQITSAFCDHWAVRHTVLPMSDDRVETILTTSEGELSFQEYFVHRQCRPIVKAIEFHGAENARPAPGVLEALENADAVVICPSNPWVSIDPILAVQGFVEALDPTRTIAVSPIVGGKALKGPAAKMFSEMGINPTAAAVAEHYRNHISAFVLDSVDAHLEEAIRRAGIRTLSCNTVMDTIEKRRQLAQDVLDYVRATDQ